MYIYYIYLQELEDLGIREEGFQVIKCQLGVNPRYIDFFMSIVFFNCFALLRDMLFISEIVQIFNYYMLLFFYHC